MLFRSLKYFLSCPLPKVCLLGGLGAELRLSSQLCADRRRSRAHSGSRVAVSCRRGCLPGAPGPAAAWTTSLLLPGGPPCVPADAPSSVESSRPLLPHALHLLCPVCGHAGPLCAGPGVSATQRALVRACIWRQAAVEKNVKMGGGEEEGASAHGGGGRALPRRDRAVGPRESSRRRRSVPRGGRERVLRSLPPSLPCCRPAGSWRVSVGATVRRFSAGVFP